MRITVNDTRIAVYGLSPEPCFLWRCLLVIVLGTGFSARGQDKEKLLQWAAAAPAAATTDSLYNVHFSYDDEDPAYCISLGRQLEARALAEKDEVAEGVANIIIANGETYFSNRDQALPYRFKAIRLLQEHPPTRYLVYAYAFLAEITGDRGKRDSADILFRQAEEVARQLNRPEVTTDILIRECQENRRAGKYARALETITRAKDLAETKEVNTWKARIDLELADLLKYSGNDSLYVEYSVDAYTKALLYNQGLRLARVLGKTVNCFLDYNKLDLVKRTGEMLDSLATHNSNINFLLIRNSFWAKYYKHGQQYEKALGYLLTNVYYERKNTWGTTLGYLYNDIGDCYRQLKQYDKALRYFDSVYGIAQKSQYRQLLVDMLPLKADAESQTGNYKAAAGSYAEFNDLYKNITRESNENKIAIMQALFDIRNREQTIELLTRENELQQTQLGQQRQIRWLFAGVIALLVALAGLLYFYLRRTHKDNEKLREQKKAIEESSKQLQEQASAISRYKTQMNPHFIFNAINSVQQLAVRNDTTNLMSYLQEFSKLMRQTLDNSDKEYISLHKEKAYLEQYLEFERKRLSSSFTYEIAVAPGIDSENVLVPPMLVQPIVENALKHAVPYSEEGHISIRFQKADEKGEPLLQIIVEDNGPGLKKTADDIHSPVTHISKGLLITQQRINNLMLRHHVTAPGFVMLDRAPETHGVVVKLQLPYLEEF